MTRMIKNGGIPHARRTECAKIKISQSDFSNLKFGKKVNWSIDIDGCKNGRSMQNLQIVIDRRKNGKSFTVQGFFANIASFYSF